MNNGFDELLCRVQIIHKNCRLEVTIRIHNFEGSELKMEF